MGRGNWIPSKTRRRGEEVLDYRRFIVDPPESRMDAEFATEDVVRYMKSEFKASEPYRDEWAGESKVLLVNGQGVELRVFDQGHHLYVAVVLTRDPMSQASNLGGNTMEAWADALREQLRATYDEVRKPTGTWTSSKV